MRQNKRIIVGIFIVLVMQVFEAQQDAQYTQYMFNTSSINPAYMGSKENFSIVGLHRSQWVGFEGAPKTQTLSLSSPLGYLKRTGLGFSIINDVIGISKETYLNIDFSYKIPFDESTLSFGLKVVGHFLDVDFQKLSVFDVNESNFQGSINNEFSPNVGAGVYFNTGNLYLGLSVPNLIQTTVFNKGFEEEDLVGSSALRIERTHFYFIGGYVFDLSSYVRFKPTILTKVVLGSPIQMDVSGNFLFYNSVSLGLAYRFNASLSAMTGFRISKPFMVGFAYDIETTALGNVEFNDGSFEVILRYHLPERCCGYKRGDRRLTPRFF